MTRHPIFKFAATGYGWIIIFAGWLQSLFLLVIRLYWGWQFHETGMGKLQHIDKVTGYFQSLGIPMPGLNAYMAGITECVGGLFLLLGLCSRISTIPLIFTMIIAYLTAFPDAVKNIFSKPDDFVTADPFLFLLTAVIVFLFGPGRISVDGIIGCILKRRAAKDNAAPGAPSSVFAPQMAMTPTTLLSAGAALE